MASSVQSQHLRDALRSLIVAQGTLNESRRPCGTPLSLPHAYALLELLQAPSPMTTSQLATKLSIDRTNVSRLCARMEDNGELQRSPHPLDKRARVLELSAHGKALATSADKSSTQHFQTLVESLGDATPNIIESLQLLEKAITSKKGR